MFRFENIDFLYLIFTIPVFIVLYILFDKIREKKLNQFGNPELMALLTSTSVLKQRWIRRIFFLVGLIFTFIALAKPQMGTKLEEIKKQGIDVLVALDVSNSMLAEDIAPNRLMKAKFEIREFLSKLKGDRVGLIPFAGVAFIQCPLTLDYETAKMFLDIIDQYTIADQGTDIGSAITTAINSFPEKERKYKVLVLITDGEDHETDIDEIVSLAKQEGIVIYTIGIGSLSGVPIPDYDRNGNKRGFKKDFGGNIVTTKLDDETLKEIALATGGKFVHVTPDNPELDEITDEIALMEKKELGTKQYTAFDDQYQWFLIMALLLFVIELLIPERFKVKKEWKGRFNS